MTVLLVNYNRDQACGKWARPSHPVTISVMVSIPKDRPMYRTGVRQWEWLSVTGVFGKSNQITAAEVMFRGLRRQSFLCPAPYLVLTVLALVLLFQIGVSFIVSLNLGLTAMCRVLEMVSLLFPKEHLRALSAKGMFKIVRIIQLGLSQQFLQSERGLQCDTLRDQCKFSKCFIGSKSRLIIGCVSRYYNDEPRRPVYYEQNQPVPREHYERLEPHIRERHLPPPGAAPTYVRTVEPRRQIIVLE